MLRVSLDVNASKDEITPMLRRQRKELERLLPRAYREFLKNTPKRTGNARRRTHLDNDSIQANYAYAQRLDEGWSKQSPEGMVKPTMEFMEAEFKKIIDRK